MTLSTLSRPFTAVFSIFKQFSPGNLFGARSTEVLLEQHMNNTRNTNNYVESRLKAIS